MKYKERFFDIQKCSEREQLMYEVYYLYKVEHEKVTSIMKKKSLNRGKVYRILRTFASENPEMAEKMAKQGKDVTPSDYEELLKKVSELESQGRAQHRRQGGRLRGFRGLRWRTPSGRSTASCRG